MRAAYRNLNRHTGFTFGAIASLSIGMSLAVAVLAVVKSVYLRPLPYRDIGRVGFLYESRPPTGTNRDWAKGRYESLHPAIMSAVRSDAPAFEATAVIGWPGEHVRVTGAGGWGFANSARAVTPNFFAVLGARPMLGRAFNTKDTPAAGDVVISYAMWVTVFGSDSAIIGRTNAYIQTATGAARVVGVAPFGMEFPDRTGMWFVLPEEEVRATASDPRGSRRSLSMIGRLRPSASFEEASSQAASLYRRVGGDSLAKLGRSAMVVPLREQISASLREPLQLWTAAAILVALLCAINFASMSLARGMRRRSELAVRSALGAAHSDVVRGLIAEAVLIATIAGAIATMLGNWYLTYSGRMLFGAVLRVQPTLDWVTIALGVGLTILVGFVFAFAPALELARVDLRLLMQGAASTPRRKTLLSQRALVALQLCLALAAVASVTAVVQADRAVRKLDAWFDYPRVVFGDVFRNGPFDPDVGAKLHESASREPGVLGAAMRWREHGVLVWDSSGTLTEWPTIALSATPDLFSAIGERLEAGRLPSPGEQRVGGSLVVSHDLAVRLAGSARTAVGMQFRIKHPKREREFATIVGVAPRLGGPRSWGLSADVFDLQPWPRGTSSAYVGLIARVEDPVAVSPQLRRALRDVNGYRGVVVTNATDQMEQAEGVTRGRNQFLASVAGFALVLAVVGLFGMTTYTTELRLRELGIRLALGADVPRIAKAMFADLWWIVPLGVGVGLVSAGLLTSFLNQVYGNPMSPVPLVTLKPGPTIAATMALVVVAIAGTAMPLRRVLTLDIMRTVQSS